MRADIRLNRRLTMFVLTAALLLLAPLWPVLAAGPDQAGSAAESAESVPFQAPPLTQPRLVMKDGADFLVLNDDGMVPAGQPAGYGLYRDDTRYLSAWDFELAGAALATLFASVDEGFAGSFVYGNSQGAGLPEHSIMVKRDVVIADGVTERLIVTNFLGKSVETELRIRFAADFRDMFEIRGQKRQRRGNLLAARVLREASRVVLPYVGLDGRRMSTAVEFASSPDELTDRLACFRLSLAPHESKVIEMSVQPLAGENEMSPEPREISYQKELDSAQAAYWRWRKQGTQVETGNRLFDEVMERAWRDLYILRQPTPRGYCLSAGLPWYAAAFGRDQAVAGLQTLPFMPSLSREIITVLAAYQGERADAFTEEQPGKIMHELRLGEMARLKEIPFVPYYGTVDATALWLMLVGRYIDWSGDMEFARHLWPNILRALRYLDGATAGGYLTYGGSADAALTNQGWKDSDNSVMNRRGELARPPVALCEVQGYLYSAWRTTAALARRMGDTTLARSLDEKSASLKRRFQKDFWMPDRAYIALALDGAGKQCDVISSNPGHLLATGIVSQEMDALIVNRLMEADMFSGWGIRTLASSEQAYNPMSYHNGTIWPHDNAMAIQGMAAAGRADAAQRVMLSLLDAAGRQPDLRLPELFCGFPREPGKAPVRYPVSCSPQAWAAGSVFQMLQACLGFVPDAGDHRLFIGHSDVPAWLGTIKVSGLRVGDSKLDMEFQRKNATTEWKVLSRQGDVQVEPLELPASARTDPASATEPAPSGVRDGSSRAAPAR